MTFLAASTTAPPASLSLSTMTVPTAIRQRRTIRHYHHTPVDRAMLQELSALAMEAPSSWNLQDRSVVVVTSADGLAALTDATGGQPQPQEAPAIFVFVADTQGWKDDRRDIDDVARRNGAWSDEFARFFTVASEEFQAALEARGALREYAIKDAMIAASFLILAATAAGLATSPMNGWDERLVKRAIGIENRDDLAIALLVAVGTGAEQRPHPGRRPLATTAFADRYGLPLTDTTAN